MTLYSSRALTAPELALVRSQGQWSKLSLIIPKSTTVYTARVNQTVFTDPMVAVTYDGGSGTLADVLVGMTMLIGSAAGLSDHGIVRIRAVPTATAFYINETSELGLIADNDYITVLDEFLPWQRHLSIENTLALMDYDIEYSSQHANCLPVVNMGTDYILSMASGGTVSITPDASESWVVGSTVASYLWVATGASATSDLDTATPTITYNAAGTYRISCTVTSALSVARTSYRYVYVNPTATNFELLSCRGDQDSGGWEFSVRCFSGVSLTDVRDRSKAFLVIDSFFNDAVGVLGQIPGAENILCSGWIRDESITVDKEHDTIRFNVSGLAHWLSQETSYPVGIGAVGSAPAAWTEMEDLTVDKGLWHLLEWRSTALNCCDFYPTGNAYLATALEGPLGTLWEQIKNIAYETLLASPTVDRYNRLFVSTSSQYIALASRSTIPTVMTLASSDWEDPIEIERIIIPPATVVDLSGVSVSATFVPTALFSRAPGRTISRLGLVSTQDRLLLESQTQLNVLSGLYLARLNNPYKVIEIKLPHANTLLDLSINQYLDLTIAEGDTPRGIALTNLKIIPKRIEYEYDSSSGSIVTRLECEGSSNGPAGVTIIPPSNEPIDINVEPIDIPLPGFPIFPPGTVWFPPVIPVVPPVSNCLLGTLITGPYTVVPDKFYITSEDAEALKTIMFMHANLRPAGVTHESIVVITGQPQYKVGSQWFNSNYPQAFTLRALDENQNPILLGENTYTSAYAFALVERTNSASWLKPVSVTEMHGLEIEIYQPPADPYADITFDFSTGAQGWVPAPQNASYPRGNIYVPTSARPAWNPLYWTWSTKLAIIPNPLNESLGPAEYQNVWTYRPDEFYGQAGATLTADAVNVNDTPGFQAIGILYTDNSWDFKEAPGLGKVATCSPANYGKKVKAFQFHVNSGSFNGIFYIDNCIISGWARAAISAYHFRIEKIDVFNVCSI